MVSAKTCPWCYSDIQPGDMVKLIRSSETDILVIYHYMMAGLLCMGMTVACHLLNGLFSGSDPSDCCWVRMEVFTGTAKRGRFAAGGVRPVVGQ